jgi:hypothetical protein
MSLAVATPGGVVPSRRGKLPSRCRGRGTGDVATHVLLPDAKCWGPFPRRSARHRRRPVAAGSSAPLVSDEPRLDLVVFTVIVDDLVFPDGTTSMGVLGGGGPQTAFGFRTHFGNFSVGIAAGVGPDFPEQCADWLDTNGVDTEGLALVLDADTTESEESTSTEKEKGGVALVLDTDKQEKEKKGVSWEGGGASASSFRRRGETLDDDDSKRYLPTPRAWQITEHDGARTQVWRTRPSPGLYAMLRPPFSTLPAKYKNAKAFHVGVHPERPDLDLLLALRNSRGGEILISVEPFTSALNPVSNELLTQLCSVCDVFSPNELEAVSLVGSGNPVELCERLAAFGAKIVCLRRGELGAVVLDTRISPNETWSVPAYLRDSETSDVTGCGNAFCGAFLASLLHGEGVAAAACWGSAAASVMAENAGVPTVPAGDAQTRNEVQKRCEALLVKTKRIK